MRAITTLPGTADSARLEEIPEAPEAPDTLLVEAIAIGVCGTDLEILSGAYGQAPPGRDRLVIGHENVGRVRTAPPGSAFSPGDLVVGVVRRPDPVPCASCAAGEWDMCKNGKFTERGITGRDGYASERYRLETAFAVPVPAALGDLAVLVEPTTILAKAWEQIERIGARASWSPIRVLVTGAGPIGLLAALLGRQRGLEVHVLDRVTDGPKPALVAALGATYHSGTGDRHPAGRHRARVHRRRRAGVRRDGEHRSRRDRLPHRRIVGGADDPHQPHRAQQADGAGEQRGLRGGERQPASLPRRGRRAGAGRPGLAASS